MTLPEFFGCGLITFGPPVVMFIITIARDPMKVIILTASAFFWLVSLLLSSLLWYAVVPLRGQLAFGLFFSVAFQELLRFAFYRLIRRAERGLRKVAGEMASGHESFSLLNPHTLAYVSGLGFGLTSGAFSHFNLLAEIAGPGTAGLSGSPQNFFLVSSFFTLAIILLHIVWSVIFFSAMDKRVYWQVALVIAVHLLVSGLTLLNIINTTVPQIIVAVVYIILFFCSAWAFFLIGGSPKGLLCCLNPRPHGS